jgi:Outer membrane protein beta-barrel domain
MMPLRLDRHLVSLAIPMLIRAIALGVAILCAGSAVAQGITTGVRGGINLASATFDGQDGATTLDTGLAPVFGVFVTIPLASWFELQPEALYSVKGPRLKIGAVESRLLLDYFEVPLLGRFSRRGGRAIDYYFTGGASVGVRLRARSRTDFGGAVEDINISDEVEPFDLGVIAGGGLEISAVVIDGRYTHGLRDIDKDKTDDVKVTNRAWSLTAGFRF